MIRFCSSHFPTVIRMKCIKFSSFHTGCCSNHRLGFYNIGLTDLVTCPVVAIAISDFKICSYNSKVSVR